MKTQWENIIIHCSDSFFGNANEIRKWHIERGWRDIGYHFVICNGLLDPNFHLSCYDGSIEAGRAINGDRWVEELEKGAHTLGMNHCSIGICMIGQKVFTNKQLIALRKLVEYFMVRFNIPKDNILGHKETANAGGKTCPNIDMYEFRDSLTVRSFNN